MPDVQQSQKWINPLKQKQSQEKNQKPYLQDVPLCTFKNNLGWIKLSQYTHKKHYVEYESVFVRGDYS